MRIIIILACCALPALQATAQKKLKYDISKTTGDTSYHTPEDRLYVKAGSKGSIADQIKSSVYRRGNAFMICFSIETGRTSVLSIEEGDAAGITLQDGTTISLNNTSFLPEIRCHPQGLWLLYFWILPLECGCYPVVKSITGQFYPCAYIRRKFRL